MSGEPCAVRPARSDRYRSTPAVILTMLPLLPSLGVDAVILVHTGLGDLQPRHGLWIRKTTDEAMRADRLGRIGGVYCSQRSRQQNGDEEGHC